AKRDWSSDVCSSDLCTTETTTQLLQKDGCRLSRTEHEYSVDFGYIHSFVKKVHGKDALHFSCPKSAKCSITVVRCRLSTQCDRLDSCASEHFRHIVSMVHAHTESQRPHRLRVQYLLSHLLNDESGTVIISGIDL